MAADLASKSSPASGAISAGASAKAVSGATMMSATPSLPIPRRVSLRMENAMMPFDSAIGSGGRELHAPSVTSRNPRAAQECRDRTDDIRLARVAGDKRTPRLRTNRRFGAPHHVELTVGTYFADHHRLVQVVVAVHREHEA